MVSAKLLRCLKEQEKLSGFDMTLGPHNLVVHDDPTNGFRWKFRKYPGKYSLSLSSAETSEIHLVYGPVAVMGMVLSGKINLFHSTSLENLVDIVIEMRRVN